jgi:hypothetical protein
MGASLMAGPDLLTDFEASPAFFFSPPSLSLSIRDAKAGMRPLVPPGAM